MWSPGARDATPVVGVARIQGAENILSAIAYNGRTKPCQP